MKDSLDNVLNIGDKVVYAGMNRGRTWSQVYAAIVIGIKNEKVQIAYPNPDYGRYSWEKNKVRSPHVYPNKLVKMP